jgi:hypothetical protein
MTDRPALSTDQSTLQKKYDDLANLYREKSKKCAQSQQLYDALKKKFMLRGVETAASENVTQTIQLMTSEARPETFQGQPSANTHHNASRDQHAAHHDYGQPDVHGKDLRPGNSASQRSSDVAGNVQSMAAPTRPVANRHGMYSCYTESHTLMLEAHLGIVNTPVQRTTLPIQGRATANRSQIPVSVRPEAGYGGQNLGSSLRYSTTSEGYNRVGTATPRSFGILNGMKVGRAGTAGGPGIEPRFSRPGAF